MSENNLIIFRYITIFIFCSVVQSIPIAQAQLGRDSVGTLEQVFSDWSRTTPGASLTIQRNGGLIYDRVWGMADLEREVPITAHTLFEAGSVSKQFTAAALLLLIIEGKLALTDDIGKYIPELPDYGHPITVHQLLTHTSGIKDWGTVAAMGGWARTTRVYTQEHVYDIIFRQKTLNFIPGTEFSYSNSNHNLMVLLIERFTGRDFEEFTQTELFKPVGMVRTRWRTDFRRLVPSRAVAYRTSKDGRPEHFMPFENTYGHAALLTTTQELIRWNQWLGDLCWGAAFERLRLLPYVLPNGKKTEYTCGALFVRTINGKQEICHTGSTAGYRSWLAYYPELSLSVAYLSNDASMPSIAAARAVSDLFVGSHPLFSIPISTNPAQIASSLPEQRQGVYKRTDGPQILEWTKQGDSLYLVRDPEWNGMYNDPWKTGARKFRFVGEEVEETTPAGVRYYRKVIPIALSDARFAAFPGRYFSEEAGGEVTVTWSQSDGSFQMRFASGYSTIFAQAFIDGDSLSLIADNHMIVRLTFGIGDEITGFYADLSQESFGMARADHLVFDRR